VTAFVIAGFSALNGHIGDAADDRGGAFRADVGRSPPSALRPDVAGVAG